MSRNGHEQPLFDNRAYPEGSLFDSLDEVQEALSSDLPPETDKPKEITPVAEVLKDLESQQLERDSLEHDLKEKGWPAWRAKQYVDAKYPDLKDPETIGREDEARLRSQRRHAKELHETKQKPGRPRGPFGPRDMGPPPHEAAKIRYHQGFTDKK